MFGAIVFKKNNGGVVNVATNDFGYAMLKMWALHNTTKTRSAVIVDTNNKKILAAYIGKDGFPDVFSEDNINNLDIQFDIEQLCGIIEQ